MTMDSIWILIIWPLHMNLVTESPQYVGSFDSRKECVEYYESNKRLAPIFECVKIPNNPAPEGQQK